MAIRARSVGLVLSENSAEPSGRSAIVAQEAAEPHATADGGVGWSERFRLNQAIVQSLVIPFVVVVSCELADRLAQVHLAEKHEVRPHNAATKRRGAATGRNVQSWRHFGDGLTTVSDTVDDEDVADPTP